MGSISTPLDLYELAGVTVSQGQIDLLRNFNHSRKLVDWKNDESNNAARAAAVATLWRMLHTHGSRAQVIAPTRSRLEEWMVFAGAVANLTMKTRERRTSRWDRIELSDTEGWTLKATPNVPELALRRAQRALVCVILDAGDTDPAFCETAQALESCQLGAKSTLIRVW